jgi:hypothetical protein
LKKLSRSNEIFQIIFRYDRIKKHPESVIVSFTMMDCSNHIFQKQLNISTNDQNSSNQTTYLNKELSQILMVKSIFQKKWIIFKNQQIIQRRVNIQFWNDYTDNMMELDFNNNEKVQHVNTFLWSKKSWIILCSLTKVSFSNPSSYTMKNVKNQLIFSIRQNIQCWNYQHHIKGKLSVQSNDKFQKINWFHRFKSFGVLKPDLL